MPPSVAAGYDTGTVVRQERVPIFPEDTVASLKARVQPCEREAVIKTLAAMASGELAFGQGRPASGTPGVAKGS
jgi:folate-dependent phosphoribosylglycinamide formyltransferase PurN